LTLAVYQVAMPLIALAVFAAFGVAETPLALAIVLMLSAPSFTGAPNFTALMGHDPAPAMRLLILGTALFPLTMLPVLWLAPGLGGIGVVILAALRLILVIAVAVAIGFAVRAVAVPTPSDRQRRSLDGLSAIVLAIVVIGLMSALGPALKETPAIVLGWLGAAVAVNFGLQALAFALIREPGVAIVAGNRNIALFLVALPAGISDPILIFIGCYQIPMYLTPLVMRRLYGVGDL
jgi:hypothetical protein